MQPNLSQSPHQMNRMMPGASAYYASGGPTSARDKFDRNNPVNRNGASTGTRTILNSGNLI